MYSVLLSDTRFNVVAYIRQFWYLEALVMLPMWRMTRSLKSGGVQGPKK